MIPLVDLFATLENLYLPTYVLLVQDLSLCSKCLSGRLEFLDIELSISHGVSDFDGFGLSVISEDCFAGDPLIWPISSNFHLL